MEQKEKQVWQRVFEQHPEPLNTDIQTLAAEAMEAAGVYRNLARVTTGREKELLKVLLEEEQKNLSCLKGLYRMQAGRQLKQHRSPAQPRPEVSTLMKRYHCARRALTEYTARSAEPEWGCVYLAMAKRQEQQCDRLTQLLGQMR